MMDVLSIVTSVAAAISAIGAAVSAYLSFRAIQANAKAAKEQRASQALFQYVDFSLRYPKLSTSPKASGDEHYEWYVVAVLETVREVLTAYPDDKLRKLQMKKQLAFHPEQLDSWIRKYPEDLEVYGSDVVDLVNETIREWLASLSDADAKHVQAKKVSRL